MWELVAGGEGVVKDEDAEAWYLLPMSQQALFVCWGGCLSRALSQSKQTIRLVT